MQYLIWKLSLVVRNHKVGKGVAALLNLEENLFYFIQSQKSGFEGAQLYIWQNIIQIKSYVVSSIEVVVIVCDVLWKGKMA